MDWLGAGSSDTELGVVMEPEVGHGDEAFVGQESSHR
jgi:hypothetical protein